MFICCDDVFFLLIGREFCLCFFECFLCFFGLSVKEWLEILGWIDLKFWCGGDVCLNEGIGYYGWEVWILVFVWDCDYIVFMVWFYIEVKL